MTTKKIDRRAEVRKAIKIIEPLLDDLNIDYKECGSCGMKHYVDFAEWQAFTKLDGILQKLQQLAQTLPQRRDNDGGDTDGKESTSSCG